MPIYSTIIIDDKPSVVKNIETFISENNSSIQVVDFAQDLRSARKAIKNHTPNLLIVNAILRDCTAFDIMNFIKNSQTYAVVYYKDDSMAIKAMQNFAIHYVVLPFSNNDLKIIESQMSRWVGTSPSVAETPIYSAPDYTDKTMYISTNSGLFQINSADIVCFENAGNETLVNTTSYGTLTADKPIDFFINKFNNSYFVAADDKFLINSKHIVKYLKGATGTLFLTGNHQLSLSPHVKSSFLEGLKRLSVR